MVVKQTNRTSGEGDEPADKHRPATQKNVLLVAYHFPPDASSTGRLRTLAFARHLPQSGWTPFVLTASPRAYEKIDPAGESSIPAVTLVRRAFALDTRRHLGWRGKYVSWLAVPDRWIWWWPAAVATGLYLVRKHRIKVIWSTFPIGTTHLVALALKRLTGLRWVADFRDPVTPAGSRLQRQAARWIERHTLEQADRIVFTTPGARRIYARRFPRAEAQGRLRVIPNGYEHRPPPGVLDSGAGGRLRLVHSGLLYNRGRSPHAFFVALADLKARGEISAETVQIVLRASGHEAEYRTLIEYLEIADLVQLAPPITYADALREQAAADGLLLFQGSEFNSQIPAKVYEYLIMDRPIFALTDVAGDTASLLDETGGAAIVSMVDAAAIAAALSRFFEEVRTDTFEAADPAIVRTYSRQFGAETLAAMLDDIV